jgi:putative addiction module component (TIGR02574 family)
MTMEAPMTDLVDDLAARGKALSPEDRSRLVEILIESLREDSLTDVEAAWDAEIERRLESFDRGGVATRDGEEVLARAKRLSHG